MITAVVLARNEAAHIVACLLALRPWVGEVILIDMESSDATVELAAPYVDKILSHALIPNFDAARNVAIPEAKFEWLWFVDADERVPAATGQLVNQIVRDADPGLVAITIPFKSYFCGQWMQHCGWWPGYTMPRVLKRGHFEFSAELHSGVRYQGTELRLPPDPALAIDHYSYASLAHYVEKFNRYTSTEGANRARHQTDLDWRRGIREMVRDLWLYYERHQGGRDGYLGWILSWLAGQYRWFSDAKRIDVAACQSQIGTAAVPQDLDEVFAVMQAELWRLRQERPSLPLGVHFRSPLWDASGYADDGRGILRSLHLGDRAVSAESIPWSDQVVSLAATETALLNAALRTPRRRQEVTITNCIPTLVEPDPEADINILRPTFETDRIPAAWLPILAKFDEIWVCAASNAEAFRRGGAAPERIRVVPQSVDTSLLAPQGATLDLPESLRGRFVFLSVFDWQWRKGWDVLLDAYCREFPLHEGAGLLLKISRVHGADLAAIIRAVESRLASWGQSLACRPDIAIWDETLTQQQMASLYRSVQAFALASRGEGWGRPYLEAMATGLPTIGTRGSGNEDFMNDGNSFLVKTKLVPVPDEAVREIPVYRNHSWQEPDPDEFRGAMRRVFSQEEERRLRGRQARHDAESHFSPAALARHLEARLQSLESRFVPPPPPPASPQQIGVQLEGEFFASHSFSNINEQLALGWLQDESLAVTLRRVINQPTSDAQSLAAPRLLGYLDRHLPQGAQVVIRHAFPPNWQPPETGHWVHIQPWEFGTLPRAWLEPLRRDVTEIWAPSGYVRDVYINSGIEASKIQVIPWGIDPAVYRPDIPGRVLPTAKTFKFLFVGGTIERKGFDLLFQAYREEFTRDEDVCLVVKDVGTQSFYRYGNHRQQIVEHIEQGQGPEIVYLDEELTEGQRASLYRACDCLVAPYRGEGFGLPILEGMACGLPPVIPRGGPTDDFTTPATSYYVAARFVPCHHEWELCGEATQIQVDLADLRRVMRQAFTDREETARRGAAASEHARQHFTWQKSLAKMTERIKILARQNPARREGDRPEVTPSPYPLPLAACLAVCNEEETLAETLARIRPFVQELVVVDLMSSDRTPRIAAEYRATVFRAQETDRFRALQQAARKGASPQAMLLDSSWLLGEDSWERLRAGINGRQDDSVEVVIPCFSRQEGRPIEAAVPVIRTGASANGGQPIAANQSSAVISSPLPVTILAREDVARLHQRRQSEPENSAVLLELARWHMQDGNFFHAECYLSDWLGHNSRQHPDYRQAMKLLIATLQRTGDHFRARELESQLGSPF